MPLPEDRRFAEDGSGSKGKRSKSKSKSSKSKSKPKDRSRAGDSSVVAARGVDLPPPYENRAAVHDGDKGKAVTDEPPSKGKAVSSGKAVTDEPPSKSKTKAVSSGKAVTRSKGKAKAVRGGDRPDPMSEEAVIVGEYSTSEDVSDYKPPYKVLFPGQRRTYAPGGGGRFDLLRELKDPRLGAAIAYKKCLEVNFAGTETNLNFNDSEEDTESEDEGEVIDLTIGKEIPILPLKEAEAKGIIEKPKLDIDRYWRKRLKEWDENEVKNLKVRDCLCAEYAMAFYNNKHDTDYEIVESLGSYRIMVLGFWYHCNFRAQRKSDTLGGCHSSPKLFFAEIYGAEVCNNNTRVTYCDIVDDRKHRFGCSRCSGLIWHPCGVKYFVK